MPPPGLWSFVSEEAASRHLPWCQTLQFLPICHWCPSSYCPAGGAQREWVCISPKSIVVLFRGYSWESHSFFCCPTPTGVYSQKLWEVVFLVLEPWVGWSDVGLGSLTPEGSLPIFICHMWVWDCLFHILYLCTSLCLCTFPHLWPSYPSGWMWLLLSLGCHSWFSEDSGW